jgi:hypothetical protein
LLYEGSATEYPAAYMAASESFVVWGNQQALHSISLADGKDARLLDVSHQMGPSLYLRGAVIDGDRTYLTESGLASASPLGLAQVALPGGTPASIVSNPNVGLLAL